MKLLKAKEKCQVGNDSIIICYNSIRRDENNVEKVIGMKFTSPTYGVCNNEGIMVDKIFERILTNEHSQWTIAIGTDSQNKRYSTKFCTAILLLEKGKGGIYFYTVHSEKRIHVVQNRMLKEAEMSINLSKKVISKVEEKLLSDEFIEKDLDVSFEIHCDLGRHGKSRDSIKAAIGWISSEFGGLVVPRVKPESTAASCVADKHTR